MTHRDDHASPAIPATAFDPRPVTLTGRHVRLEPLTPGHYEDLALVTGEPELWQYMSFANLADPARLRAWLDEVARAPGLSTGITFATVSLASGRAVGTTSFYDISVPHRHLEIGRTWLGKPARRTAINTECKHLLLRHCFETLGAHRVQLKTDARNVRSQDAIARIGATREGVLRAHMVMPDGFVRDTVMFSVIASEWPGVKVRLEGLMARPRIA